MEVFSYLQVRYCLNVPFNYYIHTVEIQSLSLYIIYEQNCERALCYETHNHIITLWRPLTHILPCGVIALECRHMIVNIRNVATWKCLALYKLGIV